MKFDHSPGEWSEPCLNGKHGCNCGYIFNSGGGTIAKVLFNDKEQENYERLVDDLPIEEAIANGRLIIAAPKLAEALIDMLKTFGPGCACSEQGMIAKHCKLVEEATDRTWEQISEDTP